MSLDELVGEYIVDVRRAEHALKTFLLARGMDADRRTLANADFGLVPDRGPLPPGGRYWFHGLGAVIHAAGRPAVDIDWSEIGVTQIDSWKMRDWVKACGHARVTDEDLRAAMLRMVAAGQLAPTSWPAHFEIVPDA